jgi:hypothetical protein
VRLQSAGVTDDLLAKLPPAARDAFARAMAVRETDFQESNDWAGKALSAVGIPGTTPGHEVYPPASSYDDVQRAALAFSAIHDFAPWPYACPSVARVRRRWLGIEDGGVLESERVELEHDGIKTTEPLWRGISDRARPREAGGALGRNAQRARAAGDR